MNEQQTSISCEGLTVGSVEQVLASALEAYVCFDGEGDEVAWNPAAEEVFGHRRERVCGQSLQDLIVAPAARAAYRASIDQVAAGTMEHPTGQRLELTAQHADGHEFPIAATLSATDTEDGRRFRLLVRDVTILQRARRFTAVEAAVSRGLADAADTARAAEQVVQAMGVVMGWPVVEMWLVDEARQILVCAARFTSRDVSEFCFPQLEYGAGLPGSVHANGHSRWIADLAADMNSVRSRLAARLGLRVAVGVPIRSGPTVLGALCIYGDYVEDPEDSLTALLAGVAAHIGQYRERRRAEEVSVELARTKDEFLAMVTHELRNPLTVISSTAALSTRNLTADVRTATGIPAHHQGQHPTTHHHGRRPTGSGPLESGDLSVDPTAADLAEIVDHAALAVADAAATKRITVNVDAAGP